LTDAKQTAARLAQQVNEIVGARGTNYGPPEDNFANIANFWNAWIHARYKALIALDAVDVGIMSSLIKTARLAQTPKHEDSALDGAIYMLLGFGCGVSDREPGMSDFSFYDQPKFEAVPHASDNLNYEGAMSDLDAALGVLVDRITGAKDLVSAKEWLRLNYPEKYKLLGEEDESVEEDVLLKEHMAAVEAGLSLVPYDEVKANRKNRLWYGVGYVPQANSLIAWSNNEYNRDAMIVHWSGKMKSWSEWTKDVGAIRWSYLNDSERQSIADCPHV
jgi:hypothetical protein